MKKKVVALFVVLCLVMVPFANAADPAPIGYPPDPGSYGRGYPPDPGNPGRGYPPDPGIPEDEPIPPCYYSTNN